MTVVDFPRRPEPASTPGAIGEPGAPPAGYGYTGALVTRYSVSDGTIGAVREVRHVLNCHVCGTVVLISTAATHTAWHERLQRILVSIEATADSATSLGDDWTGPTSIVQDI